MSTVMCILNGGNYGGNSRGAIQIRPLNAGFLEVLWLLVGHQEIGTQAPPRRFFRAARKRQRLHGGFTGTS